MKSIKRSLLNMVLPLISLDDELLPLLVVVLGKDFLKAPSAFHSRFSFSSDFQVAKINKSFMEKYQTLLVTLWPRSHSASADSQTYSSIKANSSRLFTFRPFGNLMCKTVQYMIVVTCLASVYTLVLMSLDRFLAVVHPISSISIRTERNALM